MRMWLCDPKILCRKHLLGMHLELHMFVGHMKAKRKITGFLKNNCLEPKILKEQHDIIKNELIRRNYKHRTPMTCEDVNIALKYLTYCELEHKIDKDRSLSTLINRCEECRKRYNEII